MIYGYKFGNPGEGLLAAMIEVFKAEGKDAEFSAPELKHRLEQQGYWTGTTPPTAAKTIGSYLTVAVQEARDFRRVGRGR